MGTPRFKKSQKKLAQKHTFNLYFLISYKYILIILVMYGLYDNDGILRFVNSDRDACLDYAELFALNSKNFCVTNFVNDISIENNINLDLNRAEYNN